MHSGSKNHDPDVVQSDKEDITLRALVGQTCLAQAVKLARQGKYSSAEHILKPLLVDDATAPLALDLMARIYAQQGRLADAEKCWSRAIQFDPGNDSYRAGLARIAKLQQHGNYFPNLLPAFICIAAVFIIVYLANASMNYSNKLNVLKTEIDSITQRIEDTSLPSREEMAERVIPNEGSKEIDLEIKLPGVLLSKENGEFVIKFESGLFSNGVSLKTEVREVLTALGKQLEPLAEDINVHVIGCTDDLPLKPGSIYEDNASLGLARAVTVVEYLKSATTLPISIFSAQSSGETQPAFPLDAHGNRSRNRTVILKISISRAPS